MLDPKGEDFEKEVLNLFNHPNARELDPWDKNFLIDLNKQMVDVFHIQTMMGLFLGSGYSTQDRQGVCLNFTPSVSVKPTAIAPKNADFSFQRPTLDHFYGVPYGVPCDTQAPRNPHYRDWTIDSLHLRFTYYKNARRAFFKAHEIPLTKLGQFDGIAWRKDAYPDALSLHDDPEYNLPWTYGLKDEHAVLAALFIYNDTPNREALCDKLLRGQITIAMDQQTYQIEFSHKIHPWCRVVKNEKNLNRVYYFRPDGSEYLADDEIEIGVYRKYIDQGPNKASKPHSDHDANTGKKTYHYN